MNKNQFFFQIIKQILWNLSCYINYLVSFTEIKTHRSRFTLYSLIGSWVRNCNWFISQEAFSYYWQEPWWWFATIRDGWLRLATKLFPLGSTGLFVLSDVLLLFQYKVNFRGHLSNDSMKKKHWLNRKINERYG